jgi:hypothetical protein
MILAIQYGYPTTFKPTYLAFQEVTLTGLPQNVVSEGNNFYWIWDM